MGVVCSASVCGYCGSSDFHVDFMPVDAGGGGSVYVAFEDDVTSRGKVLV